MDILFLCGMYPQAFKEDIYKNCKRGYQFAAQNLQEAIVEGLIQNQVNATVVTVPFLSTYPLGYKKPIVNYGFSKFHGQVDTYCASFINVPFLQQIGENARSHVFNWCGLGNAKIKHIIVYSLSANLIRIATQAKDLFEHIRLTIVVPDLPEFLASNFIYKALGQKRKSVEYIYSRLSYFDHFVLLSEAMADPLSLESDQYIVMEGIFNPVSTSPESHQSEESTKTILYSGALTGQYGIENLVNAFCSIPNRNFRLVLCGEGDAKDFVQRIASRDNRISFLGKVSRDIVLSLQKNASLLVNPRTAKGEYTKFSFPSKTLEYLASGTPVLMYRLPGIPPEYYEHCYSLQNTSEQSLAEKIIEILSLPSEERRRKGNNAAQFVFENKNPRSQVNRIIRLISS